jgi:hypothetical protein
MILDMSAANTEAAVLQLLGYFDTSLPPARTLG